MNKNEKIKQLTRQNVLQKERIELLENVIKDFHKKMNGLLDFCKVQNSSTGDEILQNKFDDMYQDDDL